MPKKFTEAQKEKIRQDLVNAGIEAAGRYGFRKMSIDEIAAKAGISKGAFYLFFPSKELFFLELLNWLEKETRKELVPLLLDETKQPKEALRDALAFFFREFSVRPSWRIFLDPDGLIALERLMAGQAGTEHVADDLDFFRMILTSWEARKVRLLVTDEEALALIRGLFAVLLHPEVVGGDQHMWVVGWYLDAVVDRIL